MFKKKQNKIPRPEDAGNVPPTAYDKAKSEWFERMGSACGRALSVVCNVYFPRDVPDCRFGCDQLHGPAKDRCTNDGRGR